MLIGLAMLTAFRLAGTSALSVFFYLATIGTLSLLVMYVLTNVAAARHLGRRSRWQVVVPAGGVLIAGFVLYHNVWPVPPAPYEFFPYLVLGWLARRADHHRRDSRASPRRWMTGWSGPLTLNESAFTGPDHRVPPGLCAELAVDGAQMSLQRVGSDEQR